MMVVVAVAVLATMTFDCQSHWEPHEPEPILSWVAENIYFDERQGQVPGYWSHPRFPYSRGPLAALADDSIREVVLPWGTQLGKTTILGGFLAWKADQSPSATLILCPDEPSANEHYRKKLNPILEQCESIEKRRPPRYQRQTQIVDVGTMDVYYAWAGSPRTVSGRSTPVVLVTEVGLIQESGESEGDRVQMARDRTKGYSQWRRKIVIEGKCTIEGECRVTAAYEATDRRTYHVPCPHCGAYQQLIFGERDSTGLQFDSKNPSAGAWYRCVNGCRIEESSKLQILRQGIWVRAGERIEQDDKTETAEYLGQQIPAGYRVVGEPENPCDRAGFHLPSLYSSVISWTEFAESFIEATKGGLEKIKAWVQGWLAKPFALTSRRATFEELRSHCQPYKSGTVPANVATLVMTTDVQQPGFYWLIRAWSYHATSWLIRYGFAESWEALHVIEQSIFRGPNGEHFRIDQNWIDSGDGKRTEEVYLACAKKRGFRKPLKGQHQYRSGSMVWPLKVTHYGLLGWNIDAGQAFDHLFDTRLQIAPDDPGYWALPDDVGNDYLRSLATWRRREERDKHGRLQMRWKPSDQDIEHYGDLEKYQVAAAAQLNFEFLEPPTPGPGPKQTGRQRFVDPYGRPFLITERR